MADRYWVGGSATWDSTTTTPWSSTSGGSGGASVPTAADNVIFNQASTYTVSILGGVFCNDFTVSAGTVAFATGTNPNLTVSGSLICSAGTTFPMSGTITFNATTTGKTITTNGVSINSNITFDGIGGGWSLGSNLVAASTKTTTLVNGSLTLNGFTINTGIFSSSNANTRSIAFGANYIILNAASGSAVAMTTGDGFTATGTGGFRSDCSVTRSFDFGGTSFTSGLASNAPNLFFITGALAQTVSGWWNKIDYGTSTFTSTSTIKANSITLGAGTYTGTNITAVGTGSIFYNGKTTASLTINHTVSGTTTFTGNTAFSTLTITKGILDCGGFTVTGSGVAQLNAAGGLTNINAFSCTTFTATGVTFNFSSGTITTSSTFTIATGTSFTYSGTAVLNVGGQFSHSDGTVTFNKNYDGNNANTYNHGGGTINIASGITVTVGAFSCTNSNTRSIVFGTTTAGNIVLNHTTAATTVLNIGVATGFTWTGPGGFKTDANITRTISVGNGSGMDSTNAPNLTLTGSGTSLVTITSNSWFNKLDYGTTSFTVASSGINVNNVILGLGTYTSLTINAIGIGTITTNGKTISVLNTNTAGTATLGDALTCTTLTNTTGTLNHAGFTVNCTVVNYNGGTWTNIGLFGCTSFNLNNAGTVFNFTSGTLNVSGTFAITLASFSYSDTATLGAIPTFNQNSGDVIFNKAYALTGTSTYSFTLGTITLNADLTVGIFSSNNGNTRSIVFNTYSIILAHTTASQTVLSMAAAGNFTASGTGGFKSNLSVTRTFTCGSGASQPTINPNLILTGSSIGTITNLSTFANLDFSGSSYVLNTTELRPSGTITLSTGGTFTGLTITCYNTNSISILTNGKSIAAANFTSTGTYTLLDALNVVGTITMTSGTISSNYNITCGVFNGSGDRAASQGRTITGTITLTITGGTTSTGFTSSDAGTGYQNITLPNVSINMTSAEPKQFYGGGGTYKSLNQGGMGALSITGRTFDNIDNTFNNIINTVYGSQIIFPGNITTTCNNFNLTGLATDAGASSAYPLGSINPGATSGIYASVNSTAFGIGTGDFTLETWLYVTSYGASIMTIFDMRAATGSSFSPWITLTTAGVISFIANGSTVVSTATAPAVVVNRWYHVAVCKISGNTNIYLNGKLYGSSADANNYLGTGIPTIGWSTAASGGTSTSRFLGYISQFRFVKGVGIYTGNFAVPTAPLQATQSASTNIVAITGTQTSLLLNASNDSNYLKDSSTYNSTMTAGGAVTSSISPFYTYINSSTAGQTATLTKPSGVVSAKRLYIKDITVTGGANWYAGANSTNVSNTSGWSFTDYVAVVVSSALFSFFFF